MAAMKDGFRSSALSLSHSLSLGIHLVSVFGQCWDVLQIQQTAPVVDVVPMEIGLNPLLITKFGTKGQVIANLNQI